MSRVVRLLIYDGPRTSLDKQLSLSQPDGTRHYGASRLQVVTLRGGPWFTRTRIILGALFGPLLQEMKR